MKRAISRVALSALTGLSAILVLSGCNSDNIGATPNPVSAGQPIQVSVNFFTKKSGNHATAQINQEPAGSIADLPNQIHLDYFGQTYYGDESWYSGTFEATAPTTPGPVTLTAKCGSETASTVLVVQ